jgi:hypothetical protein
MPTIAKRPVFREVTAQRIEGRNLVVGILPGGLISVRLKGTRQVQEITAIHAWDMGQAHEGPRGARTSQAAREKRRLEAEWARAFQVPHPLNGGKDPAAPAKPIRKRQKSRNIQTTNEEEDVSCQTHHRPTERARHGFDREAVEARPDAPVQPDNDATIEPRSNDTPPRPL